MATDGFGVLLKIGDGGGPEVFTTIAEVLDINGLNLTRDVADATSRDSPGRWEEALPTIKRSGELTFDMNFLPQNATHSFSAGLLADYNAGTLRNFQLVLSDTAATTWVFAAYVTGFNVAAPLADPMRASVTLKPSGQPTLA